MAHLSIRRLKLPHFKKRHYKLLPNKEWVSFSPIGRTPNLIQLSVNPEHTGCIHGAGSRMSWKHGFLKDSTSYKKHDGYKKTLEEKIEEKETTLFENKFMTFIQNPSQQEGSPLLHLLAQQATNLRSMGSTQA
jgi:hypothetical protein